MTGKPSKFDRPEWLDIPPPRGISTSYFVAEKLVTCRLKATVRLPRLIALIRKLRNEPEDVLALDRAIKLAGELLGLLWLEDHALQPKLQLKRTSITDDARHVPFSFYCSESDFHRLIHQTLHWASKIILGGLCERICEYGVPPGWPNLSELRNTNRICADSICMSIEMAVQLAPYGPVRLFGPMFVAWGAYWRQQHAAADENLRVKMDWLRRKGNELLSAGSGNMHPIHDTALIFMNDRMQGGPMSTADYLAQTRVSAAGWDKATQHSQIMSSDAPGSRTSSDSTEIGPKSSERELENIF
nr:hypothetical protein CFP56_21364 [Quercus suber]